MKFRLHASELFFSLAVSVGFSVVAFGQQPVPDAPSAPITASVTELAEAHKLIQQGKPDDAIAKLQALDSSTKGVALELGNAYYKKSDFSQAIQYLKKANMQDTL